MTDESRAESVINTALANAEDDPMQYAVDQFVGILRHNNLEPDGEVTVGDDSGRWLKVTSATKPLRTDAEVAKDEGRHCCVLEYSRWPYEKQTPNVQCYEEDNKLWFAAYDEHSWQVNFCPMCGREALHKVSE